MTAHRVAVIDIGKTNAKLALVDLDERTEIAVLTRPNTVLPGPPWPHFDVEGHWDFLLDGLTRFHADHGIDAISITTHGACAALIGHDGALAAPILDYEHDGPDRLRNSYDAIRPPFSETGAPRLPVGLNVGAQLFWQFTSDATLRDRTASIVTYPQYWGFRLTGVTATDVTSLGCHTDLWNPTAGRFSSLVETLGITDKIAPARQSAEVLGPVLPDIAARTGLSPDTPVLCGIHDSNASLLPHILAHAPPFSVVSTGTWVIAMSMRDGDLTLDPARDTLINVSALGDPVPSARFMGGREYEIIRAQGLARPTPADRSRALERAAMLLPSIVPGSGPFPDRQPCWTQDPESDGERALVLSWYLALMTDTCLSLVGSQGPVIVEGPFARNSDYLEMLAACGRVVAAPAASITGTAIGAAMLLRMHAPRDRGHTHAPSPADPRLSRYARHWQALTGA